MSERKIRRAAEHAARKAARKAGFIAPTTTATVNEPAQISASRLAANRANAQLSTGAVTAAGRAISSQNRLTHGLARHNGFFTVLPTEDQRGFEALRQELAAEHQPHTATEAILINTMAESHWLAIRAQRLADICCDSETGIVTEEKSFALYLRYHTTHRRAFHKCVAQRRLRVSKRNWRVAEHCL